MTELKKEIINTLKKLNDKIINRLSLQKEEYKKITTQDIDLLLWTGRNISLIINTIEEEMKKNIKGQINENYNTNFK